MMRSLLRRLCPDANPRIVMGTNVGASSAPSPIVLILGWGGAKHRNLNKLVTFYAKNGITSVSTTAPLFVPRAVEQFFEDEAVRLVQQAMKVHGQNQAKVPVYAHMFSNNGSWSFHNFMFRKDISFDKIVWDSGPSTFYETRSVFYESKGLSQVFVSIILNKNQYTHPVLTPLLRMVIIPLLYVLRTVLYVQDMAGAEWFPNYKNRNIALRDGTPLIPTLFMYSLGDELVEPQAVVRFKGEIEKRGVPTEENVFDKGVPHTAAFFIRTDDYVKRLGQFLGIDAVR